VLMILINLRFESKTSDRHLEESTNFDLRDKIMKAKESTQSEIKSNQKCQAHAKINYNLVKGSSI